MTESVHQSDKGWMLRDAIAIFLSSIFRSIKWGLAEFCYILPLSDCSAVTSPRLRSRATILQSASSAQRRIQIGLRLASSNIVKLGLTPNLTLCDRARSARVAELGQLGKDRSASRKKSHLKGEN